MTEKPSYEELEKLVEQLTNDIEMLKQNKPAEESGKILDEESIRQLQSADEKNKVILESIHEGYYEVDLKGTFTFVNKAVSNILGYSEDELIGMNNKAFLDEENFDKVMTKYRMILRDNEPLDGIEFELTRKDGQKRTVVSTVSLITSSEKEVIGYRGIVRDVTGKRTLQREVDTQKNRTRNARVVTIMGLAKLSEYRDNDAGAHLERMREFSKIIAQELSGHKKFKDYITEKYIDDIYQSSILHDIGKVGIPDSVLLKPGSLTPEEFEIIKRHSQLGGDAISEIESKIEGESFLTLAKEIAYCHHERWNGKGYPYGLVGDEIPLSARIVALADVYDALTSKRVYKEAFSHADAIKIIVSERGRQFDPDVVDAFMARNKDFVKIRTQLDDADKGINISPVLQAFI